MNTTDYFEITQFPAEREYDLLPETGGFIVPGSAYLASLNFTEEPVRYVALLRLMQGDRRGNHYHLKKTEHLAVLDGQVDIELRRLDNLEDIETVNVSAGQMITIRPNCYHVVTSQVPQTVMLEMATTEYDRTDVLYLSA